ncbi:hypothetical protein HG530_011193 [Fusarium avenaceum]|nr:hypothetical protein HG530_011193 [Fusarium avenaceum]
MAKPAIMGCMWKPTGRKKPMAMGRPMTLYMHAQARFSLMRRKMQRARSSAEGMSISTASHSDTNISSCKRSLNLLDDGLLLVRAHASVDILGGDAHSSGYAECSRSLVASDDGCLDAHLVLDQGIDAFADSDLEVANATFNDTINRNIEFLTGSGKNSLANGVFTAHLSKTDNGPPQSTAPLLALPCRLEVGFDNAHLTMGDGTSLIKHNLRHLGGPLKNSAALDQNTILGTNASTDHDGSWRGETKGAGAGKYDDGDAKLNANHDLTATGVLTSDSEVNSTVAVNSTAHDVIAYSLLYGHRLARHHTLIDKGLTADKDTIGGELIARSNNNNIAKLQKLGRILKEKAQDVPSTTRTSIVGERCLSDLNRKDQTDDIAKEQTGNQFEFSEIERWRTHRQEHAENENGNGERQRCSESCPPLTDLACLREGLELRIVILVVSDKSVVSLCLYGLDDGA